MKYSIMKHCTVSLWQLRFLLRLCTLPHVYSVMSKLIFLLTLCLWQLPNHQLERVQTLPVEDQTVACRCSMFENFSVLVTPSINRVVEFAKRIPGNESFFCWNYVNISLPLRLWLRLSCASLYIMYACCLNVCVMSEL